MSSTKRIGLIGLDTSHVTAFAKIFNDPAYEYHIPGFSVTCGYAGGSPDLDVSHSRVAGFTQKLKDEFGLAILDTPEAVAKEVDIVFITAVDGRVHRALFEKVASFGRPTFIDKPFTASYADAKAIVELAAQKNILLASCSSLRYADRLTEALNAGASDDPILSVDVYGPMNTQPQLPGLLWYGVHGVEMLIRVMGPGCVRVQTTTTESQDVVVGQWADGRLATYHGLRGGHTRFGLLIHRKSGVQHVDASSFTTPWYVSMHQEVMPAFLRGESAMPAEDILAVMAFIDAANTSRANQGKAVETP